MQTNEKIEGAKAEEADMAELPDIDTDQIDIEAAMADHAHNFADIQPDVLMVPPQINPGAYPYPWKQIPKHMRPALAAYLCNGVDPGGTWRAILTGDLRRLWLELDPADLASLGSIVDFLWVYVPKALWGSRQAVEWWIGARKTACRN
jgi:hypothetical protein